MYIALIFKYFFPLRLKHYSKFYILYVQTHDSEQWDCAATVLNNKNTFHDLLDTIHKERG